MRSLRAPLLALAAASSLPACGPDPSVPAARSGSAVLDHLLARYDEDGDGRVAAAEYPRSEAAFARLDRDGSGALDGRDFPDRSAERDEERALRLVGRYLQANRRPDWIRRSELEKAFAAYDADTDGRLSEGEFRARMDRRRQVVPGDDSSAVRHLLANVDPWDALQGALDGSGDGTLELDELHAYFDERATDGRWEFRARELHGVLGDPTFGRPLQGSPAPPFTLATLDGSERVSLEDFRGSRPVALIFGSYT